MKNYQEKIKNLYEKVRSSQGSYQRSALNPTRDWQTVLTSTFILVIISGIVAYYFYTQIDQGKFFVVTKKSTEKEIKIDDTLFKKIVDDINARENSMKDLKQGKSIPSDPSI